MVARKTSGFTIVELLIVIVVIAILASIATVAYTGIVDRANISAGRAFDTSLRRALSLDIMAGFAFNEGSGTVVTDSSGLANHATLNGTWTSGMESGNAVQANNNGTGAFIANNIYFGSNSFTISAWVNSSDTDSIQSRIAGKDFNNSGGYFWLNFGNGRPYIEATDSTSTLWSTPLPTKNISGKWAHIAAVVDRAKGASYVYINGKKETQRTSVSSAGVFGGSASTNTFRIGYQTSSASLSLGGVIDDVYIYNSALDLAAINQIYDSGRHRFATFHLKPFQHLTPHIAL